MWEFKYVMLMSKCHAANFRLTISLPPSLSELSEDMHADGYETIVNIDISPVVIEMMKAQNPDMECT